MSCYWSEWANGIEIAIKTKGTHIEFMLKTNMSSLSFIAIISLSPPINNIDFNHKVNMSSLSFYSDFNPIGSVRPATRQLLTNYLQMVVVYMVALSPSLI